MRRALFAIASIALVPVFVVAQGAGGGQAGVHRTADGKPDLSGIWQVMSHGPSIRSSVTTMLAVS